MHNTLESSRFFPYIAWTVVISFALFTYTLANQMNTELEDISISIERLEQKVDTMGQNQVAQ